MKTFQKYLKKIHGFFLLLYMYIVHVMSTYVPWRPCLLMKDRVHLRRWTGITLDGSMYANYHGVVHQTISPHLR